MKKKVLLMVSILMLALCSGCGKSAGIQNPKSEEISGENTGEEVSGESDPEGELSKEENPEEEIPETEEQDEKEPETQGSGQQPSVETEKEFSLQDVSGCVFNFSSGVGAWYTELRINADGTFKGHYQDADMGDTGEGYADGTLYVCNFTGTFSDLEKIDRFTYKMKLESLAYEQEPTKEEIIDDVRYVYSTAYGIDEGEDFYLYLPGVDFSALPETYRSWVSNFCEDGCAEGKLPFYGLYNEKQEEGFSSYEYEEQSLSERIAMEISFAEESEAEWNAKHTKSAPQLEMNMAAAELYRIWDDTLNTVWKLLESELDDTTMEQLRAEEREWIKFKETEAKAAGEEVEGGSMQPLLESERAAELTKERVYELAKYAE